MEDSKSDLKSSTNIYIQESDRSEVHQVEALVEKAVLNGIRVFMKEKSKAEVNREQP